MKFRIVELYKNYFDDNSFVNYIKDRDLDYDVFWFYKHRPQKMFMGKGEILIKEFQCFIMLLFNIRGLRNKKNICFAGHYAYLLLTRLFGRFLGKDYHVYMYNFYLHSLGSKKLIKRILKFLLNSDRATVIVQSPDEMNYFNRLAKNTSHFIPYCEDAGFSIDTTVSIEGDYLFSGGYTNRDYSLVLKCAKSNPGIKFVLVVSRSNKDIALNKLPENVILYEEIGHSVFNGLMSKSIGVIIPLKENVGASGQMLCLGAMKMSKPIIYADISSINYYFKSNNCGIPYNMGNFESLNGAIHKLTLGQIDLQEIGECSYNSFISNFTLAKRNEKLLNFILLDE
jgi:glycosyltransferase involved in cell wall biosynthesis